MANVALDQQTVQATITDIERSEILRESLERYQISLMAQCRNADGTVLDATGGSGKFKISAGGWGSGTLTLDTEDAQGNTVTDTLCFEMALPPEYDDGEDVRVVVSARYDDSGGGSIGSATIDVECYELDDEGSPSSDLCTTSAQNLASTFADYTFTITDTQLTGGDRLLVFVRMAIQETGGAASIKGQIGAVEVQLDIRG